jgi:hypothetical protein
VDWVLISLIAGLISGICWLMGDILLVGFDIEEEKHQEFLRHTKIKNKKLAVLMLSGSTRRLRFGALIAHFSIPSMLFSVFSLYSLAKPSPWATVAAVLLGVGFSLSPVAHVAYYYVGTLCKNLFKDYRQEKPASDWGGSLADEYVFFLNITWIAAVGITALGWAVYTVLILLGQTVLPSVFFLFTPLILSPAALLLTSKLKIGRPYLNGAGFNVALTLFFLAAIIYYLQV